MDVFPKFIIETDDDHGDCLIISKCTYHRELAIDKDKVKGGGWFVFRDGMFTFHGSSDQFGPADIEDIRNCIANDKVFENPYFTGDDSIAKKYNFEYHDGMKTTTLRYVHG